VSKPLYQKVWFILLVAASLITAVVSWVRFRIRRIREQEEARSEVNKKMAELELKALRSQMNPHFMFNSLNSIKNYILQAQPKLAAEYLSNFAHLIRMILQHSREKSITLQEELETLLLYIELEQIRFDNKFELTCVVDDEIRMEQVMIPPMLLQPFVENAIWHGLMHKKDKGHLQLQFSADDGMVACIIEDDGVGRDRAAELKSLSANKYKSMGMGITRDRIEIMNKMDALGITTEIIDKKDDHGNSTGTKIIVRIPGPSKNE
jgi:sensor histidine kinase YesM